MYFFIIENENIYLDDYSIHEYDSSNLFHNVLFNNISKILIKEL